MIDIRFIRSNRDKVEFTLRTRSLAKKVDLDTLLKKDSEQQSLLKEVEGLRARQNELSKAIPQADPTTKEKLLKEAGELKSSLVEKEKTLKEIQTDIEERLLWIPNIPLDDVHEGKSPADNDEIRVWIPKEGYLPKDKMGKADFSAQFMPKTPVHAKESFTPLPHWDLGVKLGIIDIEAAAKVSGSRFYYLKGKGVLLAQAAFALLQEKLLGEGFEPMYIPLLVRERVLYGSSHFPGDKDQVYRVGTENVEDANQLYLVGSSEPSLFAYFMDTTLKKDELPKKVMATTSCFRSEVGSWGKDVRGIKRVHQFDKLEMDMVVENDPEKMREAHEYLISTNEWLMQTLELPYRVINMCTADLGYYAAAKKYDFEGWLCSVGEYCELGSDSNTTDYQARRLNIKYKDGTETKYACTLNDTGITHRILISILDHYQQKDGSVIVPEALKRFTGFDVIEPK